ncbi:hypothetical protein M422DRAFT_265055 [Sphaerobolus stellatus SS14]|uniref:Putative ER transporter 6TM N-terminal domain-containing protein n=1 Tax=Sphaerobolus stellatus (strain SS14) TaxID=990650 RepID=A0A0C9V6R4_SPHS4|nr:hypothetical protein M422DRAFT_265055 [Sphaerobolus stellatus SS14]
MDHATTDRHSRPPHTHVSIVETPTNEEPPIELRTRSGQTVEEDTDDEDLEIEPREETESPRKKEEERGNLLWRFYHKVKKDLSWIPPRCTYSSLKPVIRGGVAAWISLVLFLIPAVQRVLGNASFLLMITAFISPPIEPLAGVIEKEFLTLLMVTMTWAWSCLATKLANLARSEYVFDATVSQIFHGEFLEAGPCVIYAVFLFIWTSLILFLRAKIGPGPFMPATVFSCLCIDISLTIAQLYPYPNYAIGETVVLPIAVHSGLALLVSATILPETVNAQFVKRLNAVMRPLAKGINGQKGVLEVSPLSDDFNPEPFAELVSRAELALTPLSASARLIKREISYGRLNGNDLREIQMFGRKLTASGMSHFYRVMDTRRAKFPETPLPSQAASPAMTPMHTRMGTPIGSDDSDHRSSIDQNNVRHSVQTNSATSLHRKLHLHAHHNPFHTHLIKDAINQSQEHHPVGVFESQFYMNIERRLYHPQEEELEEESVKLLAESCGDLLDVAGEVMDHVVDWLDRMNTDRLRFPRRTPNADVKAALEKHNTILGRLKDTMDAFLKEKRHRILEPYKGVLDPLRKSRHLPPHRFLFRAFLYQYHLLRFCEAMREMLEKIEELERTRTKRRLWAPILPLRSILTWSMWETNDSTETADEENPDVIPGISIKGQDLGEAEPRNPDALPPSNFIELIGTEVYLFLTGLGGGNSLFGLKAGLLSVVLILPNYIQTSAAFAYQNKSVWALFIAQLTLARYRGDTIFGFLARIVATFFGLGVGLVYW